MTGAGAIALTGDLPATIEAIKHTSPALLYPIKAAVAFPLVYHYLGGLRHVMWDKARYGNQVLCALARNTCSRPSRMRCNSKQCAFGEAGELVAAVCGILTKRLPPSVRAGRQGKSPGEQGCGPVVQAAGGRKCAGDSCTHCAVLQLAPSHLICRSTRRLVREPCLAHRFDLLTAELHSLYICRGSYWS